MPHTSVAETPYRLPRSVLPRHYQLTLEPDLARFSFDGSALISIDVVEPVDEIVVNACDLEINDVKLVCGSGATWRPTEIRLEPKDERIRFVFPTPIDVGSCTLEIDFSGVLNDRLVGFYRSTYVGEDGSSHVMATTQFEATDARRAFPCWDEPDLKATFGVTLIIDEDLSAVSNGPQVSDEYERSGKRRVVFGDTMKMSTYLVAFVVGDLVPTDIVDVDGVPLRVYHRPGQAHLTTFALRAGEFALRYFSEYYRIPYPGDKLDMLAIPDFAWGAMENLGAITYRETALLLNEDTASQTELIGVALTVAHEIAHMWFGDLVTMKWWNGVWLNEAFATFAETKCVDAFRPEWNMWLRFGHKRNHSMEIDALATTRPIEFPVESPEDANAMFDALTYRKGGSVLRMLELHLGEEAFRAGVARYLANNAYDNTDAVDLWEALESVSGELVADLMEAWIFTGGHPRLSVRSAPSGVVLEQQRFTYSEQGQGGWQVPVVYRDDTGDHRVLVEEAVEVPTSGTAVLNPQGAGYYRVDYTADLRDVIDARIGLLPAEQRYSLVADRVALLLAGEVDGANYLKLVQQLAAEQEPAVLSVALGGLGELDRVLPSVARVRIRGAVQDLALPGYDQLGWVPGANEDDLTRARRGLLLGALGIIGDDDQIRDEARVQLERVHAGETVLDPEVQAAAIGIVAHNGDGTEFEIYMSRLRAGMNPQERRRYLQAAAAIPSDAVAQQLLDMVLTGEIRRQDSFWILAAAIANRTTGAATWKRIERRWQEVIEAVPLQNGHRIIDSIHLRSEPDVAAAIETWLTEHPFDRDPRFQAQQLERLAVRVALRERESGL